MQLHPPTDHDELFWRAALRHLGALRIRASSSAVGQESAGSPYLTCIALTAVRLCWPSTPSTLPTLKPACTKSCCSSLISLNGSCTTGAEGGRMAAAPAMRLAR